MFDVGLPPSDMVGAPLELPPDPPLDEPLDAPPDPPELEPLFELVQSQPEVRHSHAVWP
jgi:hypothetical protein